MLTSAGSLNISRNPQNGLMTGTTLGNITGSYSYNSFGEVTGTSYNYNSIPLFNTSYTLDSLGRIDYDEYGKVIFLENPDEFTDITFAGGLYDEDTKLIHFGARDYDPQIGR